MFRLLFAVLFISSSVFADAFAPLKTMSSAPDFLKQAAKAIVRIRSDGAGTGFLINAKGWMVTNDHVVGPDNCTQQGCYVKLDFAYGATDKWEEEKEYFLEPLSSIPDLDVSVYQVFQVGMDGKPSERLKGNPFIPVKKVAAPKKTEEIFIAGNPHGTLMRWTSGLVNRKRGDWCHTTACAIGGNSGSPIFNAKGELVGIVHRAADMGEELYRMDGAQSRSTFSSLSLLVTFLKQTEAPDWKPNIEKFPSLKLIDTHEVEDIPIGHFLAAHRPAVDLLLDKDKVRLPALEFIRTACESEVKSEEAFEDPDFPFPHCSMVEEWVNCNDPKDGKSYKKCPNKDEQKKWLALFREIADIEELKNQEPAEWAVILPTLFAPSKKEAHKQARALLERYVASHPEEEESVLVTLVAHSSNDRADLTWKGKDQLAIWKDFSRVPFYERSYREWLDTYDTLIENKLIGLGESEAFAEAFLTDPQFPIKPKMDVESLRFKARTVLR